MDSINSNPYLNPSRIAQTYQKPEASPQVGKTSEHLGTKTLSQDAVSKTQPVETFSNLFGDDELERLQNNLESIANLAESALKRFNDKKHF
ncbi:hypothetical protein MLD52_00200 [Puniceicoccaceae bacterium K14]|nr:hypothetical protein [Puniceicoccaceae bacterium K14]